MKRWLIILLASAHFACGAYTEAYVQTTGSNLNSGFQAATDTGAIDDAATYTGVGDSDGTSVFTPSDGSTPASTVTVGDFASVYVTAGATVCTFIGRITTVAAGVNGAITVSTTVKVGTFPTASAGAHTITCKVGGAWKGPNGTDLFPWTALVGGALQNTSSDPLRINFKNGTNYAITAAATWSVADNTTSTLWQGYTTSPGDGGRAVIDGGTSGTSYILLTTSGHNGTFADFSFQNNGATGSAAGVTASGSEGMFFRCVFHDLRGNGLIMTAAGEFAIGCEAYSCNQSNTASTGGFSFQASGSIAINCISHHNTSANTRAVGYELDGVITMIRCIAAYNDFGARSTADVGQNLVQCDFYRNNSHGLAFQQGAADPLTINVTNCNFFHNGVGGTGYGIEQGGNFNNGVFLNNCFGAGSEANATGTIHSGVGKGMIEIGSITYTSNATPWNAPTTGDFRITGTPVKGAGYGTFLETYTGSTWTGTVGYPDIGAAQHLETGGETSSAFSQ